MNRLSSRPPILSYLSNQVMLVASSVGVLGTLSLRPGGWLLVIGDLLIRSYSRFCRALTGLPR